VEPVGLGPAAQHQPQHAQAPLDPSQVAQAFVQAQPVPVQMSQPQVPANPYAPVWRVKERVEFDITLPSGQVARILRLERDDLLRMDLLEYLDTFTPMLFDEDASGEVDVRGAIKKDPKALGKMLTAIDKVVLACTMRPRLTDDPNKVNYGTEDDWKNPNFTATVPLEAVDTFERMFIFGAAFGRSMDELKTFLEQQTKSLGNVANDSGVQQGSQ
jgi:hypothetical protein